MSRILEIDSCEDCCFFDNTYWRSNEICKKLDVQIKEVDWRGHQIPEECPLPKAKKKMTIVKVPEKYHGLSGEAAEPINKKYNCSISEAGIVYYCPEKCGERIYLLEGDNFCHSCGNKINWVEERVLNE